MNWFKVFYWISVADTVSNFFETFAIILTIAVICSVIGLFVSASYCSSEVPYTKSDGTPGADYLSWLEWKNAYKRIFSYCIIFCFVSWMGYIFVPSKKDALVIIAGGAVGNFITKDSSAKQIPSEVMTLLRDKIRAEIRDVHLSDVTDSLKDKTKEELIEMYKNKK